MNFNMGNDLFGINNAFNSQQIQSIGSSNFFNASNSRALLYLMTKKFTPNQTRRALTYNFGGEFRKDLQENLSKAPNAGYNNLNAMMLDSTNAKSAILPAAIGEPVNLSPFNDFWTFILVIDNDTGTSPFGTISPIPTRMLYSGWVADEPVTKQNLSQGYVENPNAVLSTTHHTTLTVQQTLSPMGGASHIETTGDYDYIPTVIQQLQMNQSPLYSLKPSDVTNGITVGDSAHNYSVSPVPVAAAHKSIEVPTELNAPAFHLQRMVSGMADTVKHLANPTESDIFAGEDVAISTMATMLADGRNSILNDLNPNEPITIGQLRAKYGNNLEIVVCNQPFDPQYDLVGNEVPNRRNVLTAVVSSSLPPLLAQFGLAEIAFRYNSFHRPAGGLGSTNGDRGVFQLLNISGLFTTSQDQLNLAWDQLCRYMKMTLFPIILTNGGHFDLTCHCSLGGASLINLQLLDEIIDQGLIETSNLLGGLNTPLVGNQNAVTNNAGQMYNAVQDMGIMGTPMTGLGNMFQVPSSGIGF